MGNVGDNSVSSYRLRASETQQLSYVPMADATPICYQYELALGQPSANDGPTCKLQQHTLATHRLRYR